jgi:hypothetical protein
VGRIAKEDGMPSSVKVNDGIKAKRNEGNEVGIEVE